MLYIGKHSSMQTKWESCVYNIDFLSEESSSLNQERNMHSSSTAYKPQQFVDFDVMENRKFTFSQ